MKLIAVAVLVSFTLAKPSASQQYLPPGQQRSGVKPTRGQALPVLLDLSAFSGVIPPTGRFNGLPPASTYGSPSASSNGAITARLAGGRLSPGPVTGSLAPPPPPSSRRSGSTTTTSTPILSRSAVSKTPSVIYSTNLSPPSGRLEDVDSYVPLDAGSRSRGPKPKYGVPGAPGYDKFDDSLSEPANYEFSWEVFDEASRNDFGHQESRQEDYVKGMYHVVLPDGRMQVVEYEVDKDGYRPQVRYEEATRFGAQSDQQGPY